MIFRYIQKSFDESSLHRLYGTWTDWVQLPPRAPASNFFNTKHLGDKKNNLFDIA